jgi:hypothetical protein
MRNNVAFEINMLFDQVEYYIDTQRPCLPSEFFAHPKRRRSSNRRSSTSVSSTSFLPADQSVVSSTPL